MLDLSVICPWLVAESHHTRRVFERLLLPLQHRLSFRSIRQMHFAGRRTDPLGYRPAATTRHGIRPPLLYPWCIWSMFLRGGLLLQQQTECNKCLFVQADPTWSTAWCELFQHNKGYWECQLQKQQQFRFLWFVVCRTNIYYWKHYRDRANK